MREGEDRRSFLKSAGLAVSGGVLAAAPEARGAATEAGLGDRPRGMTFATLRRGGELSLGIRTPRGVLDVARAEARFGTGAPTTIDEVFARIVRARAE